MRITTRVGVPLGAAVLLVVAVATAGTAGAFDRDPDPTAVADRQAQSRTGGDLGGFTARTEDQSADEALLAADPPPATADSVLQPGATLHSGDTVASPDGRYQLTQLADGNLVVLGSDDKAIWSSQTHDNPGAYTHLGTDGNLVVYDRDGDPLWQSATDGTAGAQVVMNNDGNAVVLDNGTGIWGTSTHGVSMLTPGQQLAAHQYRRPPDGRYELTQFADGNLVLRTTDGQALWASRTDGHAGASTTLQHDGNLVVQDRHGKGRWSSGTHGSDGAYLIVQNDGNLVLYDSAERALWSSGTGN